MTTKTKNDQKAVSKINFFKSNFTLLQVFYKST